MSWVAPFKKTILSEWHSSTLAVNVEFLLLGSVIQYAAEFNGWLKNEWAEMASQMEDVGVNRMVYNFFWWLNVSSCTADSIVESFIVEQV